MSAQHILFTVSAALTVTAGGLQFLPLQSRDGPIMTPLNMEVSSPPGFSSFTERFDLSHLPESKAPEVVVATPTPPPEPAAGLKQYKFIGLAKSDSRAAGVFEREGEIVVVARGANLEGFTLMDIEENGAHFVKDEIEAILPLQTPALP